MPNGHHDFGETDFPVLEAFFAPLADTLTAFGARHNLMLEKYYHESPSWRFNFRHPKGGVASIDVMRDSPDSIKIARYWWVDDYDTFSRSLRTEESQSYQLNDIDVNDILEDQLEQVLSWEKGTWTQVATGYERFWKPQGRKFIERDVERYPQPKV
jgi:hypothetical protein